MNLSHGEISRETVPSKVKRGTFTTNGSRSKDQAHYGNY